MTYITQLWHTDTKNENDCNSTTQTQALLFTYDSNLHIQYSTFAVSDQTL